MGERRKEKWKSEIEIKKGEGERTKEGENKIK